MATYVMDRTLLNSIATAIANLEADKAALHASTLGTSRSGRKSSARSPEVTPPEGSFQRMGDEPLIDNTPLEVCPPFLIARKEPQEWSSWAGRDTEVLVSVPQDIKAVYDWVG
jgi:hypothetical protein